MLVHLPPRFEAAAHARDIFESAFHKVSDGAQTAVTAITVNNHFAILISAFDEFLHVPVVQMNGSGDVRCPVRTRVRYIHKHAIMPIELFLGLLNLNFQNLIHLYSPRAY